ncbi:hypothetical protein EZV62_008624 [Acer yangbiense]|uniref:Uncharacterized protein n=1 Tax=Acer yangbiense TaxID=1000413 RepID=A0A5C7IEG0_9ROSI|nr:hypothetical protein EZV62_008624 [Acer yangbiense]
MAYFEPPSFSLDLDLDSQSEPRLPTAASAAAPSPSPQILQDSPANDALRTGEEDLDSLHELEPAEVEDSDVEPEPTRVLKRLRRGPGPGPRPTTQSLSSSLLAKKKKQQLERTFSGNGDDDIEEFSSPEDLIFRADEHPSTQYHSVGSSSKVSLQGHAIFTTQSSSQLKERKTQQTSDVPSASLLTSHNELMFPKLTISPLRRFQLLDSDSDSDHPSISEDVSKGAHRIDPPSKESKSVASGEKRKVSLITPNVLKGVFSIEAFSSTEARCKPQGVTRPSEARLEASLNAFFRTLITPQKDDLWKDFCPMMGYHIPTPALDEVCEEYFQSAEEKNAGVVPDRGNQQPSASDIDYMSQFSNGGASNQKGTQKVNNNRSTTRGRNSRASGGWVDPKSSATIPKDAGKRRVHAPGGQSAGHWYTSPEGRKLLACGLLSLYWFSSIDHLTAFTDSLQVYLSKNGQELTGQIAYRQYRKENGAGFRKSKKKTNSRKKKTKS